MTKPLTVLAFMMSLVPALAQNKPVLKYDINFEYDFDNREFDSGDELYTPSFTVNAARFTPSVGIGFAQNKKLTHSVMIGVDVMKNLGESPVSASDKSLQNWDLFQEITLWYGINAKLPGSTLKGYAGIFPRRFSVFGSSDTPLDNIPGRNIPTLFLSDYNRFYDNNLEGVLVTASRRHAYYEAGLDWLGMYGSRRREQFKIYTYGKGRLLDWLYAGWAGEMHHYANAIEYGDIVDNFLLSPFAEFDLAEAFNINIQRLSLSVNWFQYLHRDRFSEDGFSSSSGGQLTLDLRNWNVGIRNESYYGDDLMPYYESRSPEGTIYGADLYQGNPFYRVCGVKGTDRGLYDRLELYYQPQIASFLDLRLSAVMHFADDAFQGWQQKLSLVFNLEKAVNSGKRQSRKNGTDEPNVFKLFL